MIIKEEIRNRIRVAAAAYAYEIENDPIMTDAEFDALCLKIKPDVVTGSTLLDTFFKTEFDPNTGSWIHKHPDLKKKKNVEVGCFHTRVEKIRVASVTSC